MGLKSSPSRSASRALLAVRRWTACLLALLVCWTAVSGQEPDVPKAADPVADEVENLIRDFPKGWLHFSSEPATALNATWQVMRDADATKDPTLVCLGKPDGYIRTEKEYENFELGLEWKYPTDPNGNSGILLYTIDKDMIWPKSVQVQLHRPTAGSVFPSSGAKLDHPLPAKDLSRPVNEWNECLITSVDGKVTVSINGHKVGDVTGCMPQKGCVGLQSEGSEIHFRKIWIKPLLPAEKRLSARKLSVRHKKTPICPPDMVFTTLPDSEVRLLSHAEIHHAKVESHRVFRTIRRFEQHGKIKPGAYRNLSPYAVPEGPWFPEREPLTAP